MKLSVKMTVLFTAMMLIAMIALSSIAIRTSLDGATAFTKARFSNMAVAIQRDLEQNIEMMDLTINTLTETPSFLAALNQMVRDDSADLKMQRAAAQAAVQQLYQSPMVENYYRVTFYTRDGLFITSRADKDSALISGTDMAENIIGSFSWLDQADTSFSSVILPLHEDVFSSRDDTLVYGVVRQVLYHGQPIGYLEISEEYADLERIMGFVDNEAVIVQAYFEDGSLLFSSVADSLSWPDDLKKSTYTIAEAGTDGEKYNVMTEYLEKLHIRLYIAQSASVDQMQDAALRGHMLKDTLIIMIPTAILIAFLSFSLTASTRRLTKKVRQLPSGSVLSKDPSLIHDLTTTVSSPRDREIYQLEQVFNTLMLRLRESASTEMALREGTLQAQLSALQTQINPHFIYNTLNIISARAMESGCYDIIDICDQFAQMLRYSTDTRSRSATLTEELNNVRSYLMLAKARYEDHLEYTIDVPEGLGQMLMPRLTLQPLVENALNHGFNGQNIVRKLSIIGKLKHNQLLLEIHDNGTGFSDEALQNLRERMAEIAAGKVDIQSSGGHIGLINTCLRLYYYSNGKMHVTIRNENGAVVTLSLPCGIPSSKE